jgi:FMN-dependent oxidoreductase (nitrilotriacetate monooxygenase family)
MAMIRKSANVPRRHSAGRPLSHLAEALWGVGGGASSGLVGKGRALGRQLQLNFHANSAVTHALAWQRPLARQDDWFGISYYQELARVAERGLFDAIFFADLLPFQPGSRRMPVLDAVIICTAIAAVTEKIGVIASASTMFNEPYNIARQFSTLDHISNGRTGWNVVTTYLNDAALNYGLARLPPREERYARAEEFVEVVKMLWDGWDYAAVCRPDDSTLRQPRPIDHAGPYFTVRGPLQSPRTPQQRPVIFQAGGSDEGRDFAARHADGVFSAALTIPAAQHYYNDIKARAAAHGRDPDSIKIMPGVYVYLGATKTEAAKLQDALQREIDPKLQLIHFAHRLGVKPDLLDLDQQVPEHILERAISLSPSRGHIDSLVDILRRDRLSVGEFLARQPVTGPHRVLVGTPQDVADSLEEWFVAHAADGFNVGNMAPDDLTLFVEEVIPILQKRGLYRTQYAGATLRDHYFGAATSSLKTGSESRARSRVPV